MGTTGPDDKFGLVDNNDGCKSDFERIWKWDNFTAKHCATKTKNAFLLEQSNQVIEQGSPSSSCRAIHRARISNNSRPNYSILGDKKAGHQCLVKKLALNWVAITGGGVGKVLQVKSNTAAGRAVRKQARDKKSSNLIGSGSNQYPNVCLSVENVFA